MSNRSTKKAKELSFEESIRELSDIVDQLEAGDLPLDESVALFEKGMLIAKNSQIQLDQVEKKVEELLAVDQDGTPITRDFEEDVPF
ncbi:MAG: exodeoxyribonuclease VII small subunit [Sorangium cellulosum]|nr:MAG: exodeoxyribonuclease VII small subunit [Sorangium cellulosum]